MKGLLRSGPVMELGCLLGALYIRLVWWTGRWRLENVEILDRLMAERQPFIACFWHSRLLMLPLAWRYRSRLSIVISRSRDGRFIARAVRYLGIGTIAGSSSKGGGTAFRELLRELEAGNYAGITPDGPRGPRQRASLGAIRAAQASGAVLLPLTYGCSRRRMMRSWDRFILPLPFGRGVIRFADTIAVPRGAGDKEIEDARLALEKSLNDLTWAVDGMYGFEPVPPADERRQSARERLAAESSAAPEPPLRASGTP